MSNINDKSLFGFYSEGIVAKDLPHDSDVLTVTPIEHISHVDGRLADYKETRTPAQDNIDGDNSNKPVEAKATIEARWLLMGCSNRATPPNMIEGERVMLFRYADTEEFRWIDVEFERKIRRNERVVYMYGNKGVKLDEWDMTTSYNITVDTINKKLHIHTADNDGEYTTYDIIVDTEEGTFKLEDGVGNYLFLESRINKMTIKLDELLADIKKSTFTGDVIIERTLEVHEQTKLLSTLDVDDKTTLKGQLEVMQSTLLKAETTISELLTLMGGINATNGSGNITAKTINADSATIPQIDGKCSGC